MLTAVCFITPTPLWLLSTSVNPITVVMSSPVGKAHKGKIVEIPLQTGSFLIQLLCAIVPPLLDLNSACTGEAFCSLCPCYHLLIPEAQTSPDTGGKIQVSLPEDAC